MTTLLAALAGALIVGGVIGTVVAFRGRVPAERVERPPTRLSRLNGLVSTRRQRWRAVAAVVAALAVLLLTGWPVAAIATLAGVFVVPGLLSKRSTQQRIERLEALEQWTRRLADVLGASRALEDALLASARTPPEPIQAEVRALAGRIRRRVPTDRAVRQWAAELDDPAADRIAAALILASTRRGPGVGLVLTQLSELVAKDVATRREIDASRAEHRTTLRWVVVFLIGYTVFVTLRQSYSAPFGTPLGQFVMAIVVALYAAGLGWIHRLGRAQAEPRILPDESVDGAEGAGFA